MVTKKQQVDFDKLWKDAKKKLAVIKKDVSVLMKKGEKEVAKAADQARVNFDIMVAQAKREQLVHLIGREYVHLAKKGKAGSLASNTKIGKLIKDIHSLEKQVVSNKRLLKKKKGK